MSKEQYFLDTTGEPTLGIGLCDRCRVAFPLSQLMSDPNSPGLKVCVDDMDQFDPYRLPARQSERVNLPFVRPEVNLTDVGEDFGYALYAENFMLQSGGLYLTTEDGRLLELEEGQ